MSVSPQETLATDHNVKRRWLPQGGQRRLVVAASAIVVALVTVLFAPIMLLVLDKIFRVDWIYLSAVGQSYNGISALLSAGALVGLVVTTRVQLRQMQIMQEHLTLDMQFNILKLPLDDAELTAVTNVTIEYENDYLTKKQHLYFTIWFRYLSFLFYTKSISEKNLMFLIETEIATNPHAVAYWFQARQVWLKTAQSYLAQQFVVIIESGLKDALSKMRTSEDPSVDTSK